MLKRSLFLCVLTIAANLTDLHAQEGTQVQKNSDPTSVDTLNRALSMTDADNTLDDHAKRNVKEYILKKWLDERMIAAAGYEDNLKRAVDSWYANDRDWRKIPVEIWGKLREADRGRLKLGVDPEVPYLLVRVPAKANPH